MTQRHGPTGMFVADPNPTPAMLRERERKARVAREGPLRDQGPRYCQRPGCRRRVPAPGPKGGKPRKWCSRRCQDLAIRMDSCPDCGGLKQLRARRCSGCSGRSISEGRAAVAAERRARVEALWAEGKTLREISVAMGWAGVQSAAGAVWELRKQGADLPYRRRDLVAA